LFLVLLRQNCIGLEHIGFLPSHGLRPYPPADGVEPCLNLAQVGNSDETVLRISPGSGNDQETDSDDIVEEQTESVADLISKGTIFAVLCNITNLCQIQTRFDTISRNTRLTITRYIYYQYPL
jgi:hypothetical protein